MMPACTGPTGTWNTPSPSTVAEFVALALKRRQFGAQVEVFAQRIDFRPVVVQRAAARIGMADQFQAEQVLDFALLPVHGGDGVGERSELRFVRRHRHAQNEESRGRHPAR